jgi:hypothetical protein
MSSSLLEKIDIEVQMLSAARKSTVLIIDDQSACRATFKRILLSLDTNIEIETFSRPLAAQRIKWRLLSRIFVCQK